MSWQDLQDQFRILVKCPVALQDLTMAAGKGTGEITRRLSWREAILGTSADSR